MVCRVLTGLQFYQIPPLFLLAYLVYLMFQFHTCIYMYSNSSVHIHVQKVSIFTPFSLAEIVGSIPF